MASRNGYLEPSRTSPPKSFLNFSAFPAKRIRAEVEPLSPHGREGRGVRLYATGDLVPVSVPMARLNFWGGAINQVKIRGYRIELGEIEAAFRQHPAVSDAVLLAVQERERRQAAASLMSRQKTGRTVEAGELRGYLRSKLPDYMIPAQFVVLRCSAAQRERQSRPPRPARANARPLSRANRTKRRIAILTRRKPRCKSNCIHTVGAFNWCPPDSPGRQLFRSGRQLAHGPAPVRGNQKNVSERFAAGDSASGPDRSRPSRRRFAAGGPIRCRPAASFAIQTEGNKPPFFCIHGGGGHVLFLLRHGPPARRRSAVLRIAGAGHGREKPAPYPP